MLPQLLNMLTWWQWLILGMVPPAIVALYFLRLKRRPVEVPSTYLWHRSIEDLHVNAIWQRLRRNLLLFLQLLLIFLAMLAVLRPGWRSTKRIGQRSILLVDNSASMQATDWEPTRLDEAKRQAAGLIEQMEAGDVAMIVSFSDSARVEQMFTSNHRQLLRSLETIRPTARSTSLVEALKVAAGLANPGRSAYDNTDTQVAEPMPATVYLLSDGKFDVVSGFSLGHLDAVYLPIGSAEAANVGIVAMSVRRHEAKLDQLQAFARLESFDRHAVTVSVELLLDDQLIDADRLSLKAGETRGVAFDLGTVDTGVLTLRITPDDDLALDDQAWAVVNPPQPTRVLLITSGNDPLQLALETESVLRIADVTMQPPAFLEQDQYRRQTSQGIYELVIYDRCAPKQMPPANTLFIGTLPPIETGQSSPEEDDKPAGKPPSTWKLGPRQTAPQIIDVDPAHPLMQWIDMGDVLIARGKPLELPPGGTVLIDSHVGPIFGVAPREQFEDAVLGFALIDEVVDDQGNRAEYIGTNWPIRPSFPVFVLNLLDYFGGRQAVTDGAGFRPGQPVPLDAPNLAGSLEVRTPSGKRIRLEQEDRGGFSFTATDELGVYEVSSSGKTLQRFCVNLFEASESDVRPTAQIEIGHVPVKGEATAWETTRRELWKILLLAALVVLLVEWYIYHRRVYL